MRRESRPPAQEKFKISQRFFLTNSQEIGYNKIKTSDGQKSYFGLENPVSLVRVQPLPQGEVAQLVEQVIALF